MEHTNKFENIYKNMTSIQKEETDLYRTNARDNIHLIPEVLQIGRQDKLCRRKWEKSYADLWFIALMKNRNLWKTNPFKDKWICTILAMTFNMTLK